MQGMERVRHCPRCAATTPHRRGLGWIGDFWIPAPGAPWMCQRCSWKRVLARRPARHRGPGLYPVRRIVDIL